MLGIGTADLIFIIIIIFFIIRVTIKGFITEFFSKAAAILAALVAVLFYKLFTPLIVGFLGEDFLAPVVAFLILFLATYLIIKLLELFIGSLFENPSLRNLDRALGSFLGLLEALLFIIIILMILNIQRIVDTSFLADSFVFKLLSPFMFEVNTSGL